MNKLDLTLGIISLALWAILLWWFFKPVQKQELPKVFQPQVIGKGWSPQVLNVATTTLQGSSQVTHNINPQSQQKVCLKFGEDLICK